MHLEAAREQMISQQLRTWHVLDENVLRTMADVPREKFLSPAYQGLAFADASVPIGHDQVMLPPKIQGRLLQALALTRDDAVLDVGTGTGFLAACLARMAAQVHSIDIVPDFTTTAKARLTDMVIRNVTVEPADARVYQGSREYDAIAITAALPVYQDRFEELLAPGGRMFVVVGTSPIREAMLVVRGQSGCDRQVLFETDLPPMINAPQPESFLF
jgi:protein-L-isoaspartate(D-aspartate) O-methyltransferase